MRRTRTALAVIALAIVASMQMSGVASALPPDHSRGTCNLGGSFSLEDTGADGCAGNVGGWILIPTGECVEVNQGPFDQFECP